MKSCRMRPSIHLFAIALIGLLMLGMATGFANENFDKMIRQAEAGDQKAMYTVGYLYQFGHEKMPKAGIKYDPVQAYKWYMICASSVPRGHQLGKVATLYMTVLKQAMTEKQISRAEQMARSWKPRRQ